uniref:Coiled-coil domain-containing protein n=1 Tax=Steinernema glaseri TaxID=37863 RepID=A0A1I7YRL8_9BILA
APGAYECIKRYVTEVLRQPFGSPEPDRSASMYEIGSFGGSMNNNLETKSVHDHYQKLIAQLTMSNSSLHRENELLKNQMQRMSLQLQDHIDHLSSVYYSMHKYGYSALELPDGERVNLAKYRGVMLNFVGGFSPPQNSKKRRSRHPSPTASHLLVDLEINDLNDLADSLSKRNFPTVERELETLTERVSGEGGAEDGDAQVPNQVAQEQRRRRLRQLAQRQLHAKNPSEAPQAATVRGERSQHERGAKFAAGPSATRGAAEVRPLLAPRRPYDLDAPGVQGGEDWPEDEWEREADEEWEAQGVFGQLEEFRIRRSAQTVGWREDRRS